MTGETREDDIHTIKAIIGRQFDSVS